MNARVAEPRRNEIRTANKRKKRKKFLKGSLRRAVDRFRIISPLPPVAEGVKVPAKKKERKKEKGLNPPFEPCGPPLLRVQTTLELVIFDRLPTEEIFYALDEILVRICVLALRG